MYEHQPVSRHRAVAHRVLLDTLMSRFTAEERSLLSRAMVGLSPVKGEALALRAMTGWYATACSALRVAHSALSRLPLATVAPGTTTSPQAAEGQTPGTGGVALRTQNGSSAVTVGG